MFSDAHLKIDFFKKEQHFYRKKYAFNTGNPTALFIKMLNFNLKMLYLFNKNQLGKRLKIMLEKKMWNFN